MKRPSHARQAIAVCRQCAAELRAAADASPDPTTWRVLRALARIVEERAERLGEGKGLSRR